MTYVCAARACGTVPETGGNGVSLAAGPHALTQANGLAYCYDGNGNQTGSTEGRRLYYTVADQVARIRDTVTGSRVDFEYGADRARYLRADVAGADPRVTHYLGDVEAIYRQGTTQVEYKRYVAGVLIV